MDLSRFTEKAQEALVRAQSLAGEYHHGQIEGEHLLLALLRQSDGVVPLVVQGLGLNADMLAQQLEGELARKPQVYGGRGRRTARKCENASGPKGSAVPNLSIRLGWRCVICSSHWLTKRPDSLRSR